ncbi:MAG: 50S ribosomal protein L22 [Thermoprotei archaeon]|nr:MAG: 50S ribosomal protein L22 [Thermoprotei archaeon]
MTRWHRSRQDLDPEKTVWACGRDLRISWKFAVEVCRAIKGLTLREAMKYMEDVIKLKRLVPIRTYKKKVAHHAGIEGWPVARWPRKVAKAVLDVLKNLENNARVKGMDPERLVIVHAAAMKGTRIVKYIPRAFGRSTPFFQQLVHIEIAAQER